MLSDYCQLPTVRNRAIPRHCHHYTTSKPQNLKTNKCTANVRQSPGTAHKITHSLPQTGLAT